MSMNRGSKRSINITGSSNKTYDLDQITNSNTRDDSSKPFVVHIKLYNPTSKNKEVKSIFPKDLKVGSIWIARRDDTIGLDE